MNILFVSYYMYPSNMIGAKRPSYMVNYLVKNGYNVTIVKADNKNYFDNVDYKLRLSSNLKINNVNASLVKNSISNVIKLYSLYRNELSKICKTNKFSYVIFCGGPFFYFPLGIFLYKKYKIPYILDFRDMWILGFKRKLNWKGKILDIVQRCYEKISIANASIVVSVSLQITEMYKNSKKKNKKTKFKTVLNGFNELEVPELSANYSNSEIFKIGIFGKYNIYDHNHTEILINTLEKSDIQFHLYIIGEKEILFERRINNSILKSNVTFTGYMNYSNALEFLNTMNCLVSNNRFYIGLGTKIFDYIYLNKPIITFVDRKSENALFLGKFENAFIVESENEFQKALNEIINKKLIYLDRKYDKELYSRAGQMQIFKKVLEEFYE